ncbi:prolyl 4-hydroxylase subunit alpha-1-like, partial [Littorina saxatilis]|uniref:prolyl 4-hydroxylase subunit alpha-1-like n=1 Tax=Littorina saxatilis TaxID=31220 RepID=UPI0038B6B02D
FTQSRHDVKRSLAEDGPGHPNAAYLLIKAFVTFWISQGKTREIANILSDDKTTLPTESDLSGSKAAILRLERVYNLSASDILAGNYRGYQGPPLSPLDAYEIGKQAFTDGMLEQSERWLRLSVAEMNKDINLNVGTLEPGSSDVTSGQESGFTPLQRAGVLAVLGRVLAFKGKADEARELYHASVAV